MLEQPPIRIVLAEPIAEYRGRLRSFIDKLNIGEIVISCTNIDNKIIEPYYHTPLFFILNGETQNTTRYLDFANKEAITNHYFLIMTTKENRSLYDSYHNLNLKIVEIQNNILSVIHDSYVNRKFQAAAIALVNSNAGSANHNSKNISTENESNIYKNNSNRLIIKALAIGSSTGGPQALNDVFAGLRNISLPFPVFITQHIPSNFSSTIAEHLARVSKKECYPAEEGMEAENNKIYIARGNYHMIPIKRANGKIYITLDHGEPVQFCRPAVNPMLDALIDIYGKNVLALILTGMGSDGLDACRGLYEKGGRIIAQDEASSVVWGMPGAIVKANIHHAVLPIDEIAGYLINLITLMGD